MAAPTSDPIEAARLHDYLSPKPVMTKRHIHIYDGVRMPFGEVRHLLRDHPADVFQVPLEAGLAGVHEAHTALELDLGNLHLAKRVILDITDYTDLPGPIPLGRMTLRLEPEDHSAMFPVIDADLEVEPIDPSGTMVSLLGSYEPPLGALGAAVDRLVLHQMAELTLKGFFHDLLRGLVTHEHLDDHGEAVEPAGSKIRAERT